MGDKKIEKNGVEEKWWRRVINLKIVTKDYNLPLFLCKNNEF